MRKTWVLAFVLAACTQPPAVDTCAPARDSLHVALVTLDSAQTRLREQTLLIRLTEQQAKRYAKIVGRDPSQSRFIVGWMNRAFQGVVLDTVR